MVYQAISVAQFCGRRDGLRHGAWNQAVDALVAEVRKVDCAFTDGKVPAAILMHSRADIERRWRHISCVPIWCSSHNDPAPPFRGTRLVPVNVLSFKHDISKPDQFSEDQVRCNGRFPGAIGCYCWFLQVVSPLSYRLIFPNPLPTLPHSVTHGLG